MSGEGYFARLGQRAAEAVSTVPPVTRIDRLPVVATHAAEAPAPVDARPAPPEAPPRAEATPPPPLAEPAWSPAQVVMPDPPVPGRVRESAPISPPPQPDPPPHRLTDAPVAPPRAPQQLIAPEAPAPVASLPPAPVVPVPQAGARPLRDAPEQLAEPDTAPEPPEQMTPEDHIALFERYIAALNAPQPQAAPAPPAAADMPRPQPPLPEIRPQVAPAAPLPPAPATRPSLEIGEITVEVRRIATPPAPAPARRRSPPRAALHRRGPHGLGGL